MDDLHGKTVHLTSASSGLGPYLARRLRQAGAKFVLSAAVGRRTGAVSDYDKLAERQRDKR